MFYFNLKENNILFIIIPFVLSLLFFYYIGKNYILLEVNSFTVTSVSNVSNTELKLTGELLNLVLILFVAATVFSASAKFAASLVAKSKKELLPKKGYNSWNWCWFYYKLLNVNSIFTFFKLYYFPNDHKRCKSKNGCGT